MGRAWHAFDAAFCCVLRGKRHFTPIVITRGASEPRCLGAASMTFYHNTISHLHSWKSHIVPHSGNCISGVVGNVLHLLSNYGRNSVSGSEQECTPGVTCWGFLGEAAGLSGHRLVAAGQQAAPLYSGRLLCFSIDAEREGMGVSAWGGHYRAFNSQSVNYTAAELYLSGAADLHWRLLSGVLRNGLLFQWSIK